MKLIIKMSKPHQAITEIDFPNEEWSKDCFHTEFKEKADLVFALNSDIEDFLQEELSNNLFELLESVSFEPKARYELAEAYDEYTRIALAEAKSMAGKCKVAYCFADSENQVVDEGEYDMEPFVRKWINEREEDCLCSIDVGNAVIRSMEQYVNSSTWHAAMLFRGEEQTPVMWFGMPGERPEEGWILNIADDAGTGKSWSDFWFCEDSWEDWKNRVPDADDIFLTWMTAECDRSLPSLKEVLALCPIPVDEEDDYDTLTSRIASYVWEREKRIQS